MTLRLAKEKTTLTPEEIDALSEMRKRCARRILLSTSLASSGHPGGSLSSLDMLLVTYGLINHDPQNPQATHRDRVLMSIGHISPGVYAVLAENGYFSEALFLAGFRRTGSGFPGHVESIVPGVEWDTGNLGQGLSAGAAKAQSFKIRQQANRVIVFMGDGEQQKGQVVEAARYAHKYALDNLIAIIDRNHLQICGDTESVMPQSISQLYRSQGWRVIELADGHDYQQVYQALRSAYHEPDGRPAVIIGTTIMGKGISFMENKAKYHGSPLNREQLSAALAELGLEDDSATWEKKRQEPVSQETIVTVKTPAPTLTAGTPKCYPAETLTDNRSAYGHALHNLAELNNTMPENPKIIAIGCDLEGSVKMNAFHAHSPGACLEAGIQEHHAATLAGSMSREDLVCFFSTFGVFAISEVYNQNRLNDFNHTNLKIVATHVGLDVGEDGPTHQCIDYLGLLKNLFSFSVFSPADPNQTDHIIRHVATNAGNCFVGMGRSKTPIITDESGQVFYDESYKFQPGRADWLRRGNDATIITYGALVPQAIKAWETLSTRGIKVNILNMASLLPLDKAALQTAAEIGPILTVEDHHVETGLGAAVAIALMDAGLSGIKIKRLGVNRYGGSGKPTALYQAQGLDAAGMIQGIEALIV